MVTFSRLAALTAGLALCVSLAAPVSAQTAQQSRAKKQAEARNAASAQHRGADKFPAGPLYHGNVWLGDDPDPFIRLQIQRDLTARFGGNI